MGELVTGETKEVVPGTEVVVKLHRSAKLNRKLWFALVSLVASSTIDWYTFPKYAHNSGVDI